MLTPELEQLIEFALADGELTDKERTVLTRKHKKPELILTNLR